MYGPSPFANPFDPSAYGASDAFGRPMGGPPSEYGASAMPDFRYRENYNAGNAAFAPPGGIQTGNPLVNMGLQIGTQMAFPGQEFRPMQTYDGSDVDYQRARSRFNEQFAQYAPQLARQGIFPAGSELAQNPVAQMATDPFKMGGSTVQAFQSAYGRFGNVLGPSPAEGARQTARLVESIDDKFDDANGQWDYRKSFGANRSQTIENVDSALRFGMGGMSRNQFASDVRAGRGGEFAAQANEVTRLGKTTFGQDQSADQINDLLDKAMGGLSSVTPDKASDFLAKVQSTSRALDINAKAFAEYLAAQQKVYKEMGVGGSIGAEATMGAALTARGVSERGRASGDAILGDQNQAMAARSANVQASQGSQLVKQLRFVAAQAERMDDGESKENGVGGQGLKENVQEVGALLRAGKGREAEALFSRIRNESRLGADTITEGGRNLSEEDADRSSRLVGNVTGRDSDMDVRAKVTRLTYQRASQERGFDRSAVSEDVYSKAVAGLGAVELESPEKVEAALRAQGVAPEAARGARQALATQADRTISNSGNFAQYGRRTQAQVRDSLDQSRPQAEAENAAAEAAQQADQGQVRPLNATSGNSTRGIDKMEAVGQTISTVTAEIQKGGPIDEKRVTSIVQDLVKKIVMADGSSQGTPANPSTSSANAEPSEIKKTPADASSTAPSSPVETLNREQLDETKRSRTVQEQMLEVMKTIAKSGGMPMANAPNNTGIR